MDMEGQRPATLCALSRDIIRKIIPELSFKDKCSLELVSIEFYSILSAPSSAEGLWGTCDLMSDLKLDGNFDSKDDIMG